MRSMRARAALVALLTVLSVVGIQGTAQAAPDHTITLDATNTSETWNGAAALGANQSYNRDSGEPCPETPSGPENYCEQTLLTVEAGATVVVEVSLADDPTNDFDFYIYNYNTSTNSRGTLVDYSANPQTLLEVATIPAAADASQYLIQVVYFQTTPVLGYEATASIETEPPPPPSPDLPQTKYFLHENDVPGDNPPNPDAFDTTAPTSGSPSVATSTAAAPSVAQPRWTGDIGTEPGTLRRLRVEFWQSAPVSEGFGDVDYEITLIVGGRRFEFPFFTEPLGPGVPSQVIHQFEDGEGPLPLVLPGGPVTFEIAGHFIDSQSTYQIYYDSVSTPSNFVVNPPPLPTKPLFPPDVDNPPGLQEFLASDPSQGWTSRSEPHIAQNPLDPNMLIAGSKFYNKDPDALNEYEFKIGTYVSFDGGRNWSDLGQLATCPLADAPEDSWPNNTCYPEDVPTAEGPEEGGTDLGEEYITSDIWVQFDDEGNAYAMVLDHPPYDGAGEGNGWGMTSHKWESVSPEDVTAGNTWSERKPINFYDDPTSQAIFLDDKNTFTVNNAGDDSDGTTGTLIACWGQTIDPLIKQQIVCERSTDGGESWPEQPLPISGVHQLVIGVHVIADTQDPDTFYAMWLQYASGIPAGAPATLEFNMTTDGGLNWLPQSVTIAPVFDIPRQFPGQQFRNLSIPIMAVGPDSELYVTYAEYLDAPDPENDEDGQQADIIVRKCTSACTVPANWSGPINVTENTGPGTNLNADQFQPYIEVTKSGQVNLAYFDRRLDLRTDEPLTGNYFTDVFLSRSNDGGGTWSDLRLTHDATDPEYNAPVSPSGLFFGDYQGLVADDCFAIPFFNDTHLANDEFLDPGPVRDPEFDDGMPSSKYQESVNWRVPNTADFGGPADGPSVPCPADLSLQKTDSPDPVDAGDELTYTIEVSNDDVHQATGVEVTDTLPSGVEFISSSASDGSCEGTSTVTCDLGTLLAGASETVTIKVKPTEPGTTITNTASVSADTPDPNGDNNSDSTTTTVEALPDLTLSSEDISASSTRIVRGRTYTLTAVVHNIGQGDAENVVVKFREHRKRIGQWQTIASIPSGGTGTASVSWTPQTLGKRTITVVLDPRREIAEERENNQRAKKTFTVRRR